MSDEMNEKTSSSDNEFDDLTSFENLDNLDNLDMSDIFDDIGNIDDLPELTDIDLDSLPDVSFDDSDNQVDSDSSEDSDLKTVEPELELENEEAEATPLPDVSEEPEAMSVPDISEEPDDISMPDVSEEPDMMPLPDMSEDSDTLSMPDVSEESDALTVPDDSEGSEDAALNSMLDNILDDLDMNGSIDGEENEEPIGEVFSSENHSEELSSEQLEDSIPHTEDKVASVEKKPGLLKRLFGNIVTDEIAEQERKQAEDEKEAKIAAEEQAKKDQEEAKLKKAEKKEEKAKKKAAKAEEKARKKAEQAEKKAKKKQEQEEEAALEVTGKLNKVGVSIIVIASVIFLTVEIIGTNQFGYHSAVSSAESYFNYGKYTKAYEEILGTDVKEKDQKTYDKIMTVMKMQVSLNAYERYDYVKYYPEALNALLRGLERYDANIEKGKDLGVASDMDHLRKKIVSKLQGEFGLSEDEAYDILSLKDDAYSNKVVDIGIKKK